MSNMSIQVQNRSNNARFTVSSERTHRDEVVRGLLARNAALPVTEQIDENTIRVFLDWLASTIEHKTEAMVTAELAYVTEQLDDPMVRARRDEAAVSALGGITRARMRIGSVWGDEGLVLYGMNKPLPRLPHEVAAYVRVVVDRLRKTPRTDPDGIGGVVDTEILADALEGTLTPLRQALDDVNTEQRELHGTMLKRDAEVADWYEVYHGGATAMMGLYRMAGQREMAQRVRPTKRRAAGLEPAPVEDEPVVLPAPDAPDDDEPIEAAPVQGKPTAA